MRRAYLFVVTAFCMTVIWYVLTGGQDTRVGDTAVLAAFGTIASSTAAYVFTASWQDVNVYRSREQTRRSRYHNRVDTPEGD